MKKIKVIALDMDGVINSTELIRMWIEGKLSQLEDDGIIGNEAKEVVKQSYKKQFCNSEQLIFPQLAQKICKICEETDCYILWTSTWRKLERYKNIDDAKQMFNRRGLPGDRLISYSPCIGMSWEGNCRGSEISYWIKNNQEYQIIKCAVIDDRSDAGWNLPNNARYFMTYQEYGITDETSQQIINYLNSKEL